MQHKFTNALMLIIIIGGTISMVSCNSGNKNKTAGNDKLKGSITISGAFALYPLTVKWADEFEKIHPNVTVNVSAGGAGKGMADALSKMADLGMYSKEVSQEEIDKGAWWIAVTKDAVMATINSDNPCLKDITSKGITKETFSEIFITGKIKTWGQALGTKSKEELHVYTRSDACGAAEMWAKFLFNKKQEDIQGLGVNGDPGIADAVRKDIQGIGYNNLNYAYDMTTRKTYAGISVVPIDLNGNGKIDPNENFYMSLDSIQNAIQKGIYPSPPARDLYFVSAGKPTNELVLEFLKWILADGQKFVVESGYIVLTPEKIKSEQSKIE